MEHTVIPVPRQLLGRLDFLTRFLEECKPDYIFHLAAYGNMSSQKDEQEIFNANVIGAWNMLMASKNIDYKVFVNVGSSSEYGKKHNPMSEQDVPETDTFYGASKVAGTYLARAVAYQYKKPIVTVRPFSVYGPGEADFRFIPTVCRSLIESKQMNLSLYPCHDWIYIDDFIEGVLTAASNIDLLSGQVVNIGTGKQYTNWEIVQYLEELHGDRLMYDRDYSSTDYSQPWVADSSRLQRMGWLPHHTIEEGLYKTYGYYKQTLKA